MQDAENVVWALIGLVLAVHLLGIVVMTRNTRRWRRRNRPWPKI